MRRAVWWRTDVGVRVRDERTSMEIDKTGGRRHHDGDAR
jgi:hypothetical protein